VPSARASSRWCSRSSPRRSPTSRRSSSGRSCRARPEPCGRGRQSRLEAFSDGVFAIAITLLVLELSVPEDQFDDLLAGILDQWPSYLAYLTSFLTIGGVWLVHHGILRRMRYADIWIVRVNLLLLLAVSFLPFPTKLVAEAISSTSAERIAVLFYGATLLVISALVAAIGRYVAERADLRADGVTPKEVRTVVALAEPSLGFYVLLLVFAVFAPQLAAFGLLAVAVIAVALPPRLVRRRLGRVG
jgi:uncharacterized membrane protein